jgi:CubicO group peptidase (beta-lactamase class C family)
MKKLLTTTILLILVQMSSGQNPIQEKFPDTAGINALMQGYLNARKLPGMIAMVARHDTFLYHGTYGVMKPGIPMREDAIFRIASMTKPVTAVAVMILYDRGCFKLDDPVAKYIPEFRNLKVLSSFDSKGLHCVPQEHPMTVRELLMHTSGLAGGGSDTPVDSMYHAAGLSDGTLKDMISKLAAIPLLYQPGTRWNYSRSSDVLAYLVEVISGKPFDVFLNENLFNPLNMTETGYWINASELARVPAVYVPDDSAGIRVITDPVVNDVTTKVSFLAGNGGLLSTASDYMSFIQMLMNNGEYRGTRILKSETVRLMTTNQITHELMPSDGYFGGLLAGMGFGFGVAVVKDPHAANTACSPGSYWWAGTANTYFYIDPKEDLAMLLMMQFVPNFHYPVFTEFREAVYRSIRN